MGTHFDPKRKPRLYSGARLDCKFIGDAFRSKDEAGDTMRYFSPLATIVHISLLVLATLLSGCASTPYVESKVHLRPFTGGTRPTYVANPELHSEYEILRASGIYQLSSDTDGARKLTLHPMKRYGRCANPLMLSALTLGIVPGFLPGAYVFEYDLERDGTVERYEHQLPVYERISIWEWLIRRDTQKVLAEALAWSTARGTPNHTVEPTSVRRK